MESRLSNHKVHFDNTTPAVGDHPDSIIAPDYEHMKTVIARIRPSVIVTCGSQAFAAIQVLAPSKPVLAIPHPTFRVVTNQLFIVAADVIKQRFKGVVRLRQLKGEVKCEVC